MERLKKPRVLAKIRLQISSSLFLDTGMRVSELCALDRSAVDIDDFSATVREGKGGKDRLVLFTDATVMQSKTPKFGR